MEWVPLDGPKCLNEGQTAPQSASDRSTRVDQPDPQSDDQHIMFGASEWFSQVGQLEGILSQLDSHLENGQLLASKRSSRLMHGTLIPIPRVAI